MKLNDVLLLGGLGAVGLYLYSRRTVQAAPVADVVIRPLQFTESPGIYGPTGSQQVAALVGKSVTALTGIPGFDKFGSAIAGLFGKGKREADTLTGPDGLQTQIHAYLADLSAAWNQALNAGVATAAIREQVKIMMRAAGEQFYEATKQFPRAGPGAEATIKHVIEDILIRDMDRLVLA